jgi:hypothetical protein
MSASDPGNSIHEVYGAATRDFLDENPKMTLDEADFPPGTPSHDLYDQGVLDDAPYVKRVARSMARCKFNVDAEPRSLMWMQV